MTTKVRDNRRQSLNLKYSTKQVAKCVEKAKNSQSHIKAATFFFPRQKNKAYAFLYYTNIL